MKRLFFSILLLFSLNAFSQIDTSSIHFKIPSDSTEIGKPDGQKINKIIGQEGGTISSEDGKVQLIFPSGALSSSKEITIQPISNLAPNGSGKSYQFEPSGIHFLKPVELIIHYTDKEEEECPADLMGLAMQNDKGKWSFINYQKIDTINKTLIASINHFSVYSNVKKLLLVPEANELVVGESTKINIIDLSVNFEEKDAYYDYTGLGMALFSKDKNIDWSVNGINKGNKIVGTVEGVSADIFKEKKLAYVQVGGYTAPHILPPHNPVSIKAKIYVRKGKTQIAQRALSCKISVFDAYSVKLISQFSGRVTLGSELIDSATLNIIVGPDNIILKDVKNYEPILIKEGKNGPFSEKIFVKGQLGTIEVNPDRVKNTNISKDYPHEVLIEFKRFAITMYKIQYISRAAKGEIQQLSCLSLPIEINFIANGKYQRIRIQSTEQFIYTGPEKEDEPDVYAPQEYLIIVNPFYPNPEN